MAAAALLAKNPHPTHAEIGVAMNGNLCRCMTYSRIEKAIVRASEDLRAIERSQARREPHMTSHVKTHASAPAEISRRSFLVAAGAAGLVCGFAGLRGADGALAATRRQLRADASGTRSGRTALVTVNVAKADMGQHIASTMAQLVAEELGATLERHARRARRATIRNTTTRCSARSSPAAAGRRE